VIFLRRLGVLLLVLLCGCAQVVGPRGLMLSQDDLQRRLAKSFPLQRKLLEVISVTVDTPTVEFLAPTQRIASNLSVTVQDRLSGREVHGAMAASFGVAFDASAGALKLVRVSIDSIAMDGVSANEQKAITRLGALIAREKLEGFALYRFTPEDLGRAERLGYTVGAIDITPQGLAVQLVSQTK
jgi:hypothetical protein